MIGQISFSSINAAEGLIVAFLSYMGGQAGAYALVAATNVIGADYGQLKA